MTPEEAPLDLATKRGFSDREIRLAAPAVAALRECRSKVLPVDEVTPRAVPLTAEELALLFEPCRDFGRPQSCYTNDGTGLWCDPCLARLRLLATLDARELDVELKATVDVPEDAPPSGGDAHRWYLAGWTERADAIRAVLRGDQR